MEQPNTKRTKVGEALLAKAQMIDIKSVRNRLNAFAATHRAYCEAQRQVDEAESLRRLALQHVEQLDAVQSEAIEALAVTLITEGEARLNPFERFTIYAPGQMKALPFGEEATAVHELVVALKSNKSLSPATKTLADSAEQAALAVEATLPDIKVHDLALATARHRRDPLQRAWDNDFNVLRSLARAIDKAETPGLFANLFGHTTRTAQKVTAETTTPQPAAPVAASAPETTVA